MAKGGQFERKICGLLSEWWTGDKDDSVFWRSSMSGGRATVRGRKGKKTAGHCGDICATDKTAEPLMKLVTIEAKKGYNKDNVFNFVDQADNRRPTAFEEWLLQCDAASELANVPYWLLIVQRDRKVCMVYLPYRFFIRFVNRGVLFKRDPFLHVKKRIKMKSKSYSFNFVGLPLKEFMEKVTPKTIRKMAKEER